MYIIPVVYGFLWGEVDFMTNVERDILQVLLKCIFEQGLIPETTLRHVQNQIRTVEMTVQEACTEATKV